jgi:hypothetical protein
VLTAAAGMARFRALTRAGNCHRRTDVAPLSITREFWSPPVSDGRRIGTRPRMPILGWLMPLLALGYAYLSAVLDARGHLVAGGWLLGGSVCALLGFGFTVIRHCCLLIRYRREAPG